MFLSEVRKAVATHYRRIKLQYAKLPQGDGVQYVYGYTNSDGDRFIIIAVFTSNVAPGGMFHFIQRDMMRVTHADLNAYRLVARCEVPEALDVDPDTGDLI